MAAKSKLKICADISGLGNGISIKDIWDDSTAPEAAVHVPYQVQETADTEETLNVGGVDTVRGVFIRAIENDIAVDTSFVSTFSTELVVREGQSSFFVPSGTVYIKNDTAAEQVTFELLVWGSQD